ncbi:MAG: DedA family protein [Bacteroidales bacterium]|nr:DedA family protein [Bacteroidales bacterium]
MAATEEESATLHDFKHEAAEHYSGWLGRFIVWYSDHITYPAVGALMTLESSFIPFPSEVIIPPAVMVAADPQEPNGMKIWLIVLAGTIGALLGAYLNYFLALWLGRPIVYKFADSKLGHLLQLSGAKVERAERYFNDHGSVSTLIGRFIPVIRQLISIPAGLARMNLGSFTLYTTLGALLWNIVLALLGYLAAKMGGMAFIFKYSDLLSKIIIAVAGLGCIWLVAKTIFKNTKNKKG